MRAAPGFRHARQEHEQEEGREPEQLAAGPAEDGERQRGGHQGEDERDAVDAGEGGEAQRDPHVDSGIAEREPGEAEGAVGDFDGDPQRGHRGGRPPAPHEDSGEHREDRHVQALGQGE